MPEKPECYGKMLPDLSQLEYNQPCRGKVFTVCLESLGIGIQSRKLTADSAQWDLCQQCPVFASCRDLSMMRLALERALDER
ncbi:MAG: hypothetical protein HN849_26720 [Victivallales bacterium]|nr:hypothetical protein [Victivallales bacterium]